MKRDGCSVPEAEDALASQMPQEAKLKRADIRLANDGDVTMLRLKVDRTVELLLTEAHSPTARCR